MATIDLGKIKLNWRGTWSSGTAYIVDDVVQYTDTGVTSSFVCVAASTGNVPSTGGTVNTTYWNLMAKGTDAVGMSFNATIVGDGSTVTSIGSSQGYFIDTSSATATVQLPASPSLGDRISITDYAKTFHTNRLLVQRNGNNIEGSADDWTFYAKGTKATLTFESSADSTHQGWKITEYTHDDQKRGFPTSSPSVGSNKYMIATSDAEEVYMDGDFMVHKFMTSGTWKLHSLGSDTTFGDKIEYLIIGGGGSGGTHYSGGGGAGGYRANNAYDQTVTVQDYTITVGAGCSQRTSNGHGNNGSASNAFGLTSDGGGGGGAHNNRGRDGGSGGGSGHGHTHGNATGNGSGNRGGNHQSHNCGGGGGAHQRGGDQHSNHGCGHGGRGEQCDITGVPKWYAGGGGGSGHNHTSHAAGGLGGGGGGAGAAGEDGTGAGGCATEGTSGTVQYGGKGGDGIVIVRYKVKD